MFCQRIVGIVRLLIAIGVLLCFSVSVGIADATVEILELPEYPIPGYLEGRVTGVDPNFHYVATYIHVEGRGWWTKPTFDEKEIPIDPNGMFVVDVATGDLDEYARIYDLQVLPIGEVPIEASGDKTLPMNPSAVAETYEYRNGRTLDFSGRTWAVKEAPLPADPGNGPFSARPEDVFVDGSGHLNLTITDRGGDYWSTEVILTESLGYGTYTFHTDYRADILDPHATFGAFTWDSFGGELRIPDAPLREIDIEDSQWGDPNEPLNTQYVVQPHDVAGNRHRFSLPDLSEDAELTRYITWLPGRVHFVTAQGNYPPGQIPSEKIVDEYTYVEDAGQNRLVPEPGRETFRFNLYLNKSAPAGSTPIEVIVTDFMYTPPGDFDFDGDVDGTDFLKWQRGESPTPYSPQDLADWEVNYGRTVELVPTSVAIPEPTTCTLALAALCLLMRRRF